MNEVDNTTWAVICILGTDNPAPDWLDHGCLDCGALSRSNRRTGA